MQELYPLTNPQKSIWLTESYYPNTCIGNISGTILIDEVVDFSLLEKALNIYVQKNDAIRLHFTYGEDRQIMQYVSDYSFFSIPKVLVKNDSELEKLYEKNIHTPFTLIDSDLFAFTLISFPDGHGGLQVTFHHLVADAWTMSLFIDETMNIYDKLLNKIDVDTSANLSYIDYIKEEEKYKLSEKYKKDEDFWNLLFSSEPEIASMKKDKTKATNINAKRKIFSLDNNLYKNITLFCQENKVSIFTFLMCIYSIYLAKINNLGEVTIGSPILNRMNFKEKHTAGMFISTIAFNSKIDKKMNFNKFVSQLATNQLSMFRHQRYPYQELLKNLKQSHQNINNLYDVALSYQNARDNHLVSNINYHSKWFFNGFISDPLEIHFYDMDNTGMLDIYYDYQTQKFNENEIKVIHNRILWIIKQVLNNNSILIEDIEFITPNEKKHILSFNEKAKSTYPSDKNIITLFSEQVQKNPNKKAVIFEEKSLTYKQLDEKSNILANYLIANNVSYQDVVALFMDKSLECIVSILAILKVGAIYLPIDILYPQDRISYILKDSNAKCILSYKPYLDLVENNLPIIYIQDINIYRYSNTAVLSNVSSNSIAYIMYTSGSTGTPKGVLITHKGILRLVKNTNYITFNKDDKILQTGSIVFDACTFEIWGALLNGLELYLLKKSDLLNPAFFENYIIKNKITTLFLTTALFNKFCEYNSLMFRNLKYLLTGGEAVSKKHMQLARKTNPNLNLIHVYGPTENTTFSTYYNVEDANSDVIPIGFPISNTSCFVVSTFGGLSPIGIPGELLVGGDGVSLGYLNREDLNKEKFIDNPFGEGKIYRTGDLVELLPDGSINFIGRIDNQVKIRGFRIELSEIDSVILSYPNIKESITIVHTIGNDKYICSYIASADEISFDDLKLFLKEHLPVYMIPSYFVRLDKLPLNINGKIERKKLPPIDLTKTEKEIILPKNDIQYEILSYLKSITKKEIISIDDNFTDDLNLDSLNSMELATKLYKYDVSIQDIANFPTIEKLSEKIEAKVKNNCFNNTFEDVSIINNSNSFDISNVLLTGVTGFLGIHILKELLESPNVEKVFCLIRKKNNITSIKRLEETFKFYYPFENIENFTNKLVVLDGDFTYKKLNLSREDYNKAKSSVTCVIHCGAKVKHYGKYEEFYNANVARN